MIIKGSKRGGAKNLALHLMSDNNDHVEVLAIEGFVSDKLPGALHEIYALSRGTQAQRFMLSISFNPPEQADVPKGVIYNAVMRSLQMLHLDKQPHCLVSHEKEGRRHYHCVVSLIDAQEMKAIKVPYYKKKLNGLAKELFIENNWDLPKGFKDPGLSDPRNFTLSEWQQAKRQKLNPRQIKAVLQECWAMSDGKASFKHALAESGHFLAKGERRAYVAVNWQGEVYSLSRALGVKTKELQARLGEREMLPSVAQIKAKIANEHTIIHQRFSRELALKHKLQRQPFKTEKATIIKAQRQERAALKTTQNTRHTAENKQRLARIRKGWRGLWDFFTGQSFKLHTTNESEAKACAARDHQEKETLIKAHLNKRQQLQTNYTALRQRHQNEKMQLNSDFVAYAEGVGSEALKRRFSHAAAQKQSHKQDHNPAMGL
jgi:hypothetical protein